MISPQGLVILGYIGFLIDIGVVIALIVWEIFYIGGKIKDRIERKKEPRHQTGRFFQRTLVKDMLKDDPE